jgi:NADH-quinone oxidoreductase subunit L
MVVAPLLVFIPLIPFVGFLLNASFGRRLSKSVSGAIAVAAMVASFGLSVAAFVQLIGRPLESRAIVQQVYRWISSGSFEASFALRVDPLSALMILVVTGIGTLIHIYSTAYMHEERDSEYARYFSYLNLFASFMLVLVLGANFLVMFVGWEGVGLCSYLLIGFWFEKKSASDAGKKAFIVNRIGDFGFILGVLLIFVRFGTVDFQQIAGSLASIGPETSFGTISLITLLLFVGATGKSAQIPLFVWLPDAMEGPTPVSALIHAATMVTAGVYMIGRNAVLFSHAPMTLEIVAVVGVATAFFAGTIGLVQNDIKRVLAYSTVSQLGYMFLAMGVGAYSAGIFHLYTHAFFKALLFLGSGAVIHALAGEQDLRRMGGLKNALPVTYWTFLIGALAIVGVPGLAGFFSKDEILYQTFASGHTLLWVVGLMTSLLTAIYMFRLVFMAFYGPRHWAEPGHPTGEPHAAETHHHLHDAPRPMAFALVVLAAGSIVAGYIGLPGVFSSTNRLEEFLAPSFGERYQEARLNTDALTPSVRIVRVQADRGETRADVASDQLELGLMAVSVIAAVGGIGIAVFFFLRNREASARVAERFVGLYTVLRNKYYVDEIYDAAVVQPTRIVAEDGLWKVVDVRVIDGSVNGVAESVRGWSELLRRLQTGSVRAYAASLFLGVVALLGYYLWR